MTFYQELQLNQAGSKAIIRNSATKKEKHYHMAVYVFKILLTMAFCMAFVMGCGAIFGSENSVTGVVLLLCVMVFRFADFGIRTSHSVYTMAVIFAILTFGPRLANMCNAGLEFIVNSVCILFLMLLGCHNVLMANQSTLVLGYLLLYGYDVTGKDYQMRIVLMTVGAVLTILIFYRNHRKRTYKRGFLDLFREFDLTSSRTRWQLTLTFGVSSILLIAHLCQIPRAMWAGIATMSVLLPFQSDMKQRIKGRIPGNIAGGTLFFVIYNLLPDALIPYIGVIGGIGVGFSATYGWQAVFNSLGAMTIAVGLLGVPGSIFFRIFNNALGALYALAFQKVVQLIADALDARQKGIPFMM